MPRVQYLVDEITFQRQQGSRLHQLETVLTQRGDEGWELVTMMTPGEVWALPSVGSRTFTGGIVPKAPSARAWVAWAMPGQGRPCSWTRAPRGWSGSDQEPIPQAPG